MKTLVYFLFAAMFFTACEKSDDRSADTNVAPAQSLSDDQINEKIAGFYAGQPAGLSPADTIKTVFKTQFPGAWDIEWEYCNGVYEVDFEIGDVDHEAWYDENALLLMYKYDIRTSALPEAVKNAIAADYPGYRIDDAEKVFKGTVVGYRIELEGKTEIDVFYKEDGTFVDNPIYKLIKQ